MRIDLMIPTRGRPERLRKTIKTAFGLAHDPSSVRVWLRIDEDDQAYDHAHYPEAVNLHTITGPRHRIMSDLWNDLYRAADGEIMWHGNDDMYFHAKHWDKMVRDAFAQWPDMIGMVFGNDGYQGDQLAAWSFTSRRAADIIGTWLPPYFGSCYNDTWLDETYKKLGRAKFIQALHIPHEHWSVSPLYAHYADDVYRYRSAMNTESTQVWEKHRGEIHRVWIPKLKEHMK